MTEKQRQENLIVEKRHGRIMKETENLWWYSRSWQLNHCQAYVYDTGMYYILRSYHTIVAAIDKETDICYYWLRLVYGYTATSAQHIRKFSTQYGNGIVKSWKER